jgi:hypothetical protein
VLCSVPGMGLIGTNCKYHFRIANKKVKNNPMQSSKQPQAKQNM